MDPESVSIVETAGASDDRFDDWSRQHWGGMLGLAYAACWLASALLTGIAVEFSVNATPGLLHDVGNHRLTFVAANIVGAIGQLALPGFLVGLADHVDWRRPSVAVGITFWAISAILFVISCAFHAVFGHVPGRIAQEGGNLSTSLVREAQVLHNLGDFFYFAGVITLTFALAVLLRVLRLSGRYGATIRIVAWISIVTAFVQFGWLTGLDPLQDFGVIGLLGQITVVFMLSVQMLRYPRASSRVVP